MDPPRGNVRALGRACQAREQARRPGTEPERGGAAAAPASVHPGQGNGGRRTHRGVPRVDPVPSEDRPIPRQVEGVTEAMAAASISESTGRGRSSTFASSGNDNTRPKHVENKQGITHLSDRMKVLLINGTDYDVKLCVKDKEFQAHSLILRARSPVFARMHDTLENKNSTINLDDCDPDSFYQFLLYVYSESTENLLASKALQLYYPAHKFDFPVLKEWCVSLLKSSLSVKSICDVIVLATENEEKELLEVALNFFVHNVKEIIRTMEWRTFYFQNPSAGNSLLCRSLDIAFSGVVKNE